jgi:DNA-binding NtrC family response regulator
MSGEKPSDESTRDKRGSKPPESPRKRALRIVRSEDPNIVGRCIELDPSTTLTIGRREESLLVVNDPAVSGNHLRVYPGMNHGLPVAEDCGTRNGSFLNGRKLDAPTQIQHGHVLAIGDTLMVVDSQPAARRAYSMISGDEVKEVLGWSYESEYVRRQIAFLEDATSVLLLGETGSGKEVAADALARMWTKPGMAYVKRNCANIDDELAGSILFGHKKHAFTGANSDRVGAFKEADGGTLFLDEVGELSPPVQARLLRVLQHGEIEPLGSDKVEHVSVRVVFATNRDLKPPTFREDLLARMGSTINIPNLAARRADILLLFRHFLKTKDEKLADFPTGFDLDHALLLYSWPGNIRELSKLAEELAKHAKHLESLELEDLPEHIRSVLAKNPEKPAPAQSTADVAENDPHEEEDDRPRRPKKSSLKALLAKHGGNKSAVARELAVGRTQVVRWIKYYGLDDPEG